MKHFVHQHKHHFGLWLLSAIVLISSIFWLNRIKQEEKVTTGVASEPVASSTLSVLSAEKEQLFTAVLSKPAVATDAAVATATIMPSANSVTTSSPIVVPAVEKINVTFKISTPVKTRELTVAVPTKSTIYDTLLLLNQEKRLAVEFKMFTGMGAMVQAIDDVANDTRANKFWLYYINGQSAQVGISFYTVKPDDLIEWKYEASQF